ncbi:hypothetical protein RvY_04545-2 [Ramazzottius varieornatus]|uniref:BZIP domain-containing protein n=1 Tax=Ramazzottius varieornatus TaxID=947166 RepID=A0A1D1URY9_RAMVA|nr:hypothetical protein RvY_04545-2 [Ramazzottius varieornatus]
MALMNRFSHAGSAEDDSMSTGSGSDTASHNSSMEYHQEKGMMSVFQYDPTGNIFVDDHTGSKPSGHRRHHGHSHGHSHSKNEGYDIIASGSYETMNKLNGFTTDSSLFEVNPALMHAIGSATQNTTARRPRSEKKPIPSEQKDQKYFERRRRNNYAAKKSRDYRKAREDQVAGRASELERENTALRAQLMTLKEESEKLQQAIVQRQLRQQAFPFLQRMASLPSYSHIQV